MAGSTITIRRRSIGRVTSWIGGLALVTGLIAIAWAGRLTTEAVVLLIVAAISLAAYAIALPAELVGLVTGRGAQFGTVTVVSTALLIGIVGLIYVQLARAAITADLTQAELYSLSPESERVLVRLREPLQIVGFYSPRLLPQRDLDDQFFRLYETATNGLITRRYIDPDAQPALAQRFGLTQDGQTFLVYLNETGDLDLETITRVPRAGNQERDMTGAIARLIAAGTTTVYITTGMGDRDMFDEGQEGILGVSAGMRESGISTLPLSLQVLAQAGADIPADAAAVLIVRPLIDFDDSIIALLDRYLARGGSLFIMADVLFTEDRFLVEDGTFNRYLWENFGIRALDAVVVDYDSSIGTPLDILSALVFAESDIAERLDPQTTPTLFSLARAVDVNVTDAPRNIANGRVIITSENSYGERDLDRLSRTNTFAFDPDVDLPPPLTTVVWSTNLATNAKIVLVGDSSFVSNGYVTFGGNGILFTDTLSWLIAFEERIAFNPQAFTTGVPLIFVDQNALNSIAFVTIILMPGAALVAGLAVWARRAGR